MTEADVPLDTAQQILAQGERYLQSQLEVATASDQRATTVATFFGTMATAVIAGSMAYWDAKQDLPILLAGLVGASAMIAGACMCLWAARPVDFYFPGNHPAHWFPVATRPLSEILFGEAQNYQEHIEANDDALKENSKMVARGAALAVAAPLLAVATWLAVGLIHPSSPAERASAGSQIQLSSDETSRSPL